MYIFYFVTCIAHIHFEPGAKPNSVAEQDKTKYYIIIIFKLCYMTNLVKTLSLTVTSQL